MKRQIRTGRWLGAQLAYTSGILADCRIKTPYLELAPGEHEDLIARAAQQVRDLEGIITQLEAKAVATAS